MPIIVTISKIMRTRIGAGDKDARRSVSAFGLLIMWYINCIWKQQLQNRGSASTMEAGLVAASLYVREVLAM